MPSLQPIRIVARLRPPLPGELCDSSLMIEGSAPGTQRQGQHVVSVKNPRDSSQVFEFQWVFVSYLLLTYDDRSTDGGVRFNSCYGADSTQNEIFANEVSRLIDPIFQGMVSHFSKYRILSLPQLNRQLATVFAYGVTSSGKTHTMQGTANDPGIIPRAVKVDLMLVIDIIHSSPVRRCYSAKTNCRPLLQPKLLCHTWRYTKTRFMTF